MPGTRGGPRNSAPANNNNNHYASNTTPITEQRPFDERTIATTTTSTITYQGQVTGQNQSESQQNLHNTDVNSSNQKISPTPMMTAGQVQSGAAASPPPPPTGSSTSPSNTSTSIPQQQQQQLYPMNETTPTTTTTISQSNNSSNPRPYNNTAPQPPTTMMTAVSQRQQQQQFPNPNMSVAGSNISTSMSYSSAGVASTPHAPSYVSSNLPYFSVNSNPHPSHHQQMISVESPLPTSIQRGLGDRSNEKRKNAALEIELLIKQEANNFPMIASIIAVLSKDFCTSMNSNYRKGGLVGLAATAIGLLGNAPAYLNVLLPPVLHCFDDPESRVRYYACESLYNIAKVSRQSILKSYFHPIFDGLAKLYADVDVDVKNGANLLDRLIKDIVTEAGDEGTFHIDQFLPLLQNYIRRTNPYIRQLIVGWITLLDSIPDISMLDYLPDFLDGLFNMLSDSNREIRQAADSALSDFLRELSVSTVLEFGPIISILVYQCKSKERLNRLTAITWLAELTHHPRSGGDALLAYHADILGAIMCCISDDEKEIRLVAERTNDDLLLLVKEQTNNSLELRPILDTLIAELLNKHDVPTKMASLRWINMLMEKRPMDMNAFTNDLLPVLLKTLSDPSDAVVLLNLQVLSRISLSKKRKFENDGDSKANEAFDKKRKEPQSEIDLSPKSEQEKSPKSDVSSEGDEDLQFELVLTAILNLFAQDRKLLETRGSLIVRKLCVLLNAKTVYMRMADTLATYEATQNRELNNPIRKPTTGHQQSSSTSVSVDYQYSSLQFISTMVQTLNLILLTASELHDLRSSLARSFDSFDPMGGDVFDLAKNKVKTNKKISITTISGNEENKNPEPTEDCTVFATLYHCWCHNPVSTFCLCLLARAYDLSFALVQKFSDMEDVSVGFLMQMDKLVHLLESPIFVHLRLQLLNVDASYHAPLLKSIYGILMCLPQGDAYRLLNDRLATVCNLRDNLGVNVRNGSTNSVENVARSFGQEQDLNDNMIVSQKGLDMRKLLERFDYVMEQHKVSKNRLSNQHQYSTGQNLPQYNNSDASYRAFQQEAHHPKGAADNFTGGLSNTSISDGNPRISSQQPNIRNNPVIASVNSNGSMATGGRPVQYSSRQGSFSSTNRSSNEPSAARVP